MTFDLTSCNSTAESFPIKSRRQRNTARGFARFARKSSFPSPIVTRSSPNNFREYFYSARWTYDSQAQLVKNEFNRVVSDVGLTDPSARSLTDREGYLLAAAPDLFQAVEELLSLIEVHAPAIPRSQSTVIAARAAVDKALNEPSDE
jgi:hypothetical protein